MILLVDQEQRGDIVLRRYSVYAMGKSKDYLEFV